MRLDMHNAIIAEELHLLVDPVKVGDAVAEVSKVLDLDFPNLTFYRMMSKTLCPKKGDHVAIEGFIRNLLINLAYSKPFNIEDFFIRNLMHSVSDPFMPKPFTPWIQLFLDLDHERPYKCDTSHEHFVPNVQGPYQAPS